jgi:hypothetical protein
MTKPTPRELNTIIAALRYYQGMLTDGVPPEGERLNAIHDIASNGQPPLSPEDVDDFIERLDMRPESGPKRYLVPAFLLVEADDADHATEVAGEIASDVNSTLRQAADNDNHLLLDEEAANIEVEGDPSGEFPHATPAIQACLALVAAYDAGKETESVDWSDVDSAFTLALKAIGRTS